MTVKWNDTLILEIEKAVMRGIVSGAEGVQDEATSLILEGEKTGRIYRRRGVTHQASAPGESPASDTGALVKSSRIIYNTTALTAQVNWSTDYSARLEFGFMGVDSLGRNYDQAPRPYARPALANRQQFIVDEVVAEIRKVL